MPKLATRLYSSSVLEHAFEHFSAHRLVRFGRLFNQSKLYLLEAYLRFLWKILSRARDSLLTPGGVLAIGERLPAKGKRMLRDCPILLKIYKI